MPVMVNSCRFTLGSGYSFNRTDCVWMPRRRACPGTEHHAGATGAARPVCLPIEPLPQQDVRKLGGTGTKQGWARDSMLVYRSELLRYPGRTRNAAPCDVVRCVYVDIGANFYSSSIGGWFRKRYPASRRFHVIAFEPDPRFARSYARSNVELRPYAAWVRNTSLQFAKDPHPMGGGGHLRFSREDVHPGGSGHGTGGGGAHGRALATRVGGRTLVQTAAVDIAEFLRVRPCVRRGPA